jgi:type 1 fimbria pilin
VFSEKPATPGNERWIVRGQNGARTAYEFICNPKQDYFTLTLAADSTATGIAYQGLYNNNPISFGPDSSVAGNPGQFGVTASPTTGGPVFIPLGARYIRTGTIQPGTVKGLATFTMSYQ